MNKLQIIHSFAKHQLICVNIDALSRYILFKPWHFWAGDVVFMNYLSLFLFCFVFVNNANDEKNYRNNKSRLRKRRIYSWSSLPISRSLAIKNFFLLLSLFYTNCNSCKMTKYEKKTTRIWMMRQQEYKQ